MKTQWEIRSSIQNELRSGWGVDDDDISDRFIDGKINAYRAKLMEAYFAQFSKLDPQYYQRTCCLEVKCEEITCDGISSGEFRYYVELPDLMVINAVVFISFFGTGDMKVKFTEAGANGLLNVKDSIWTGSNTFYVREGNKAYLENPPTEGFTYACLVAVLDNPMEDKCFKQIKAIKYPMPSVLVSKMEYDIVQQLIKPYLTGNPDKKNDAVGTKAPFNP